MMEHHNTSSLPPASIALSRVMFAAARQAAVRAKEDAETGTVRVEEDVNFSFHTLEAVVLAVTAAEAVINELIYWFELRALGQKFPPQFAKKKLSEKWFLVPTLVGAHTFSKGTAPWQDFDALVTLRDCIIHYKWGWDPPACIRSLEARGLLFNRKNDETLVWATAVCTNKVARWAVNTVADLFEQMMVLLGDAGIALGHCDAAGFPRL